MTSHADERGASCQLPEPEAAALLSSAGIDYPAHQYVHTGEDAVGAAENLGYPVVLKVVSPDITHKSDVGGVVTGIVDAAGVSSAVARVRDCVVAACPEATISGYLVCAHVSGGHELIIGGLRDATFGPTVMFGLGGIFTEVLGDVTFRVAPLSGLDAEDMLGEIRGASVLRGARTGVVADSQSIVNALLAVSRLMVERDDIAELDLNPVLATADAVVALDARILVSSQSRA